MVVESEVLNYFLRFSGVFIAEFAVGGTVNLALKMKGDMITKNLDLKPTIDAMMREFMEDLNGVPVILVARFGVISKSTDRIFVSHGGQRQ
ncbi:hypothetical protein Tco_1217300 [Tanacetum coccineum]